MKWFFSSFFWDLLFTSKNQVQRCKEHGSQNVCHCFIIFYFERDFLKKQRVFFYLLFTKIFIILPKLKQGQDKTARIKEAFSQNTHFEFLKAKRCLLWMLQVFLFEAQKGPCFISSMNLRTLPTNLKSFLPGFVQRDTHPKVYGSITQMFINQKFDSMSHFD